MKNIRSMVQAALIAAVYVAVSLAFAPLTSGLFQLRFAEALTVLPALTPAAIPGLLVGCLLTNVLLGYGPVDIIFGSLASLAAAYLSYRLRSRKWLVPLPPVLVNAVVVGFILDYAGVAPFFVAMLWVGLGQLAACYGLGYPLLAILNRYKDKIFGQ